MQSNAGMVNRQWGVDLRKAQVSAPQLTLWLGLDLNLLNSLINKTEVVLETLVSPPFNQLRGLLSRQESY